MANGLEILPICSLGNHLILPIFSRCILSLLDILCKHQVLYIIFEATKLVILYQLNESTYGVQHMIDVKQNVLIVVGEDVAVSLQHGFVETYRPQIQMMMDFNLLLEMLRYEPSK